MRDYNYNDINIVYEDNKIIVAVKPQNIPSQEDSTHDMDMLRLIKEYRRINENKPGDAFVGLVHRLDRPTGGLMVFAKNSKAAGNLTNQIINGVMSKSYCAIVRGIPDSKKGTLRHYLAKDEKTNTVKIVTQTERNAKYAELDYTVLATNSEKNVALVKIDLKTGRSHQIRVQLASLGNPIFGDLKYGFEANKDINGKNLNLALYATDLKIDSLTTDDRLFFRVFPPSEEMPWALFNISAFLNIRSYDN